MVDRREMVDMSVVASEKKPRIRVSAPGSARLTLEFAADQSLAEAKTWESKRRISFEPSMALVK